MIFSKTLNYMLLMKNLIAYKPMMNDKIFESQCYQLETRFSFCTYIDRCVLGSNKLANYTKKSKLKSLKLTSCTSDPFNIGLSLRNYPFNIKYQYN